MEQRIQSRSGRSHRKRRLTAVQATIDFGPRGNTGYGGLLDNGDPHIREVVKAAREEPPLPKLPVVPAGANREHAIAIFGKKEVDRAVEPSDACIREPLIFGFRQRAAGRSTSLSKALPQTQMPAMGKSARIAIKAKGRIFFINAADVIAVEAKGNYVLLLHTSSSYLLRESISTLEEKLNLHGFVRIHRSVLVNAAFVEEIHPWCTGEYGLRVRGGREFTVTRTYKKNLQLLAQLWIGMEGFAAE
jgi:DNA-binding LytR/AlgR family response regulator